MFPVHIVAISDDGFMVPYLVMLTSAKSNKLPTSHYRIHFICDHVSSYYRRKLLELTSPDFEIVLYDGDTSAYCSVEINLHVTPATFLKIHIPEILSDVDKVLHIDGDVIVQKDLSELYQRELCGKTLGVVRSMTMELGGFMERRGIDRGFNAGIMLMDLSRMRAANATAILAEKLLSLPKEWSLLEQDCLNVVYYEDALYLPPRYNCFLFSFIRNNYTIEQVNSYYGTSYSSFEEMNDDAVMIHLAGTPGIRPWQSSNGVMWASWQRYYEMSPVSEVHLNRRLMFTPSDFETLDARYIVHSQFNRVADVVWKERKALEDTTRAQVIVNDSLRSRVSELKRGYELLNTRHQNVTIKLTNLEKTQDVHQLRQERVQNQVSTQQSQISEQKVQHLRLAQEVRALQYEVSVQEKRAGRVVDKAIGKLRGEVAERFRQEASVQKKNREDFETKMTAICPEPAFLLEVYEVVIARMKRRARRLKWLSLLCFGKKKAGYLEERRQLKKSISRVSAKLSAMQQKG